MDTENQNPKDAEAGDKPVTRNQSVVTFELLDGENKQDVKKLSVDKKLSTSTVTETSEAVLSNVQPESQDSTSIGNSKKSQNSDIEETASAPASEDERKAARKERIRKSRMHRFTLPESRHSVEKKVQRVPLEKVLEGTDHEKNEVEKEVIETKIMPDKVQASLRDLMTDDDEIDNLLHDYDESDLENELEERRPPRGDTIKAKSDFFNYFEIPSFSDISEELSIEEEMTRISIKSHSIVPLEPTADVGKFYDPLTGESVSTTKDSRETDEIGKEESDGLGFGEDDDDDLLKFEKFDELNELKSVAKPVDEDADIFVRFHNSVTSKDNSVHHDADDLALLRNKRDIKKITHDFLNELFRNVVNEAELILERDALQLNLDVFKLHKKLNKLKNDFLYEKDVNNYLNSKMCEYYKRAKNFRVISPLSGIDTLKEHNRYKEALARLDFVMCKASEAKKKNAYLISSVLMDLTYAQTITLYTEEHLEQVILNTLFNNKSENLRKCIERELRLMAQKRCEISDTRLYLITRKHTVGRITDRIRKLEQINDDICMNDFIAIQNQVVALDKKIEERNADLGKLRTNYHAELHLTQHNREKAYSLQSKLKEKRKHLEAVQITQFQLRERLYKAKLERGRIRKQNSDLSFQGGLLSMPALMYDYDETVEKVTNKQANIQELKETFKRLNQRIAELESRCT